MHLLWKLTIWFVDKTTREGEIFSPCGRFVTTGSVSWNFFKRFQCMYCAQRTDDNASKTGTCARVALWMSWQAKRMYMRIVHFELLLR